MDIQTHQASRALGTHSPNSSQSRASASTSFANHLAASQQKALKENYSIASWQRDYSVASQDLSMSSAAIGEAQKLMQITQAASADGKISSDEQRAIDSYRSQMSATQELKAKQLFNSRYQSEIAEYQQLFATALKDAKQELGLEPSAHYNDFNSSPETQLLIEQKVQQQLLSNPRAQRLMAVLNIQASA